MPAYCPWCMADLDFNPKKVRWICAGEEKHIRIPSMVGGNPVCPECGAPMTNMACPNSDCRVRALPTDFDKFDEYIYLTLVGPKSVGKTVYMTMLTEKISKIFRDNYRYSVTLDPMSIENQTEERNRLYSNHMMPVYTSVGNQKPIILRFKFSIDTRTKMPRIVLVIQDTPGEIYTNEKSYEIHNPPISDYLQKSDGILFLVDPLQMEAVRNCIALEDLPNDNINELGRLFNNVLEQFSAEIKRRKENVDRNGKIKTKLATILMKEDAIGREPLNEGEEAVLIGSDSFIRRSAGTIDLDGLNIISQEIEEYINDNADGLATDIKASYERGCFKFFAVSALGTSPSKDENGDMIIPNNPIPFRIADPIIWMLSATGSKLKLFR